MAMKQTLSSPKIPLSMRLYIRLLQLYPQSFQEAFGRDMVQVFQDTYRAMRQRWGWLGLARLWAWALIDLGRNVLPEHYAEYQGGFFMRSQRVFDAVLSVILLILCWPILLLIALLTLLDSGRPILFKQERVGQAGRPFVLLKFRTMTHDDRRDITRLGRILRRTCLDELPQLLNVLRGDMALIGPRPELSNAVNLEDPAWQQVLQLRPGITGLWQVSGKADPTQADRLTTDLHYVQQRNWRLNLRIMLKTLQTIFRQ